MSDLSKLPKWAREHIANLQRDAEARQALAWPNFEKPQSLPRPDTYAKCIHGWEINTHGITIREVWQSSVSTYYEDPSKGRPASGTRMMPAVYATQRDAWLAMIHEKTIGCGVMLAQLWRQLPEKGEP